MKEILQNSYKYVIFRNKNKWLTHIKKCMFHLYFLAENVGFRQKSVNFAVELRREVVQVIVL